MSEWSRKLVSTIQYCAWVIHKVSSNGDNGSRVIVSQHRQTIFVELKLWLLFVRSIISSLVIKLCYPLKSLQGLHDWQTRNKHPFTFFRRRKRTFFSSLDTLTKNNQVLKKLIKIIIKIISSFSKPTSNINLFESVCSRYYIVLLLISFQLYSSWSCHFILGKGYKPWFIVCLIITY